MLPKGLKNSLNKIRQISSDIYHQYIPILEDDTDISAIANPVLTVPEVYNEFCNALVNRIVYTAIETKTFNSPLKGLEGNVMPLGYAGQEIYVNPAKGRQYNPNDFAGILQKYEADVKVQYLVKNYDMQYPLTVIRTKLKEAFVSWETLDNFISGLVNSLYNGMYIDEWKFTKALVSSAYKQNMVQVETVANSPTGSEGYAKAFTTKARELFLNFQMPSTQYNAWYKVGGAGKPITTWTNPEDIVILIRNDVRAYLDVNVLANAFQIDKAVLLGNIYPVDNFDVYSDDGTQIFDGSSIYGMIADRNWFKIKPIDQFMEQQYNSNNRAMQYYLNNIKLYEFSLFANAMVFATGESTVTATALSFVDGNPTTVAPNKSIVLEIATTPANATGTVTFTSSDTTYATVTKIDDRHVRVNGVANGSSTITATDGTNSDTLAITVAPAEIKITKLTPPAETISVTTTEAVTFTVTPADGNTPIYYTSSNDAIFTVEKDASKNNKCTITGVADGTATLIATTGEVTALITVTVDVA